MGRPGRKCRPLGEATRCFYGVTLTENDRHEALGSSDALLFWHKQVQIIELGCIVFDFVKDAELD